MSVLALSSRPIKPQKSGSKLGQIWKIITFAPFPVVDGAIGRRAALPSTARGRSKYCEVHLHFKG